MGDLTAVEYALLAGGAVTFRPADIPDGHRFRIDARDHEHTVVWVRRDLSTREARAVHEAVTAVLETILSRRRRAELVPVAELEGDESFLSDLEGTGTDGAADLAARQRRRTFGVVSGEG